MYSNGIVYKIICNLDNNICFIGSTFNQLRYIWNGYKTGFKYWVKNKDICADCLIYEHFEKHGISNFTIIKIKEYLVCREHNKDNRHLLVYEQLWINRTKCINIELPFIILEKIQNRITSQKYYDDHKEYFIQKGKQKIEDAYEIKDHGLPNGIKFLLDFVKNEYREIKNKDIKIPSEVLKGKYKLYCNNLGIKYHFGILNKHIEEIGILKPKQLTVRNKDGEPKKKYCYKINTFNLHNVIKQKYKIIKV